MKLYHRISDHEQHLDKLYKEGRSRGKLLAWDEWKDCFSVVPGSSLFIYGAPASGKTEWAFEIMLQMSELYDWKHVVCSPETGSPAEVYDELMEKAAQASLSPGKNQMSEQKKAITKAWVDEHFFVIDPEDVESDKEGNIGFRDFYKRCREIELSENITINCTLIDPFDEVDVDWESRRRPDFVLRDELIWHRRMSKNTGWYNIITLHVASQKKITKEVDDKMITYYPSPDPQETMHGQEWFRRAFTMHGLWRPPIIFKDEFGDYYTKNSTVIRQAKRKPKRVMENDNKETVMHLHFTQSRNRYYLINKDGEPVYATEATIKEEDDRQEPDNDFVPF